MAKFHDLIEAMNKVRGDNIDPPASTRVLFESSLCEITLKIQGKLCKRRRRVLAVAIFRQLRPLLGQLWFAWIRHDDDRYLNWIRDEQRGASQRQALRPTTGASSQGLSIRMRRLELKWSQTELSKRCGISRPTISDLERGKILLTPQSMSRVEEALFGYTTKATIEDNVLKTLDKSLAPPTA